MLYSQNKDSLVIYPADLLLVAAITYLGSGIAYGHYIAGTIYHEAAYSLGACLTSWLALSIGKLKKGYTLRAQLLPKSEYFLLLLCFSGIGCMIIFIISQGFAYISSDKIERSETISNYFFLRVPFYAALISLFILYSTPRRNLSLAKELAFLLALIICLLEMNREIIIIIGFIFLLRRNYYKKYIYKPTGLFGFIIIMAAVAFTLFLLKPLLYLVVLGQAYEGGLANFGEVVNWYRWLDYAHLNNINISEVQRNDFLYLFSSLFLPFSNVESSSKIWFSEILGNHDAGRTYGYSGVLWLSHYFPNAWICLPWAVLMIAYSRLIPLSKGVISMVLALGLTFVSFRFFRSEWPLVVKTYLWTFVYPTLAFIFISKLRLGNNDQKAGSLV